jgi:hypothetical protein
MQRKKKTQNPFVIELVIVGLESKQILGKIINKPLSLQPLFCVI